MQVIDCIKDRFSYAVIGCCSEKNCELVLKGLNNYVVLKGEKLLPDRKSCDCIIFESDNYFIIGIVELKSKTVHASDILEKLSNSSIPPLKILEQCDESNLDFQFYPIVLAKKWHPSEFKVLSNKRITIRGKKYSIILKRCGIFFTQIISMYK